MLIEWMEERQGIEQDVETQQLMQTVMQQVLADEGIEMEVICDDILFGRMKSYIVKEL